MINFIRLLFFRLSVSGFNYKVNYELDAILNRCMDESDEFELVDSKYDAVITFNNGVIYEYWNENKYYAWLQDGKFIFKNSTIFRYSGARPTIKTIHRFKRYINSSKKPKINTDKYFGPNISKVRSVKLDKLLESDNILIRMKKWFT